MATYIVTTLADNDDPQDGKISFREAVSLSNQNDEPDIIRFHKSLLNSEILLSQGQIEISDAITINGDIDKDGSSDITINANNASRALYISSHDGVTDLRGLTITGGHTEDEDGAGIFSLSDLSIRNSIIVENHARGSGASGGGIFITGDLDLRNSTIQRNSVYDDAYDVGGIYGGGIYAIGGVNIEGSRIVGNTAAADSGQGGGIAASTIGSQKIVIKDSVFKNNVSKKSGGGIWIIGETEISGSTISNNQTLLYGGGGIRTYRDTKIIGSTISNNIAEGRGGGGVYGEDLWIYSSTISNNYTNRVNAEGGGVYASRSLIAVNSTFVGNHTKEQTAEGGAIFVREGAHLSNITVTGNTTYGSTSEGGGIYIRGRAEFDVIIEDSIIFGNFSNNNDFDEIFLSGDAGSFILSGTNIIGGDEQNTADVFTNGEDVGDIGIKTVFARTAALHSVLSGELGDNGGPVETVALRRSANNPAIDASAGQTIPASDARNESTVDQLGFGNSGAGARDLGAFEASGFVPSRFSDNLEGSNARDTIDALAGNDTVLGFSGPDRLKGSGGADDLFGGGGNDTLLGGLGRDKLIGGGKNDVLNGGADNDTLIGGGGADKLIGGSGKDRLTAGAGADTLTGGGGADQFVFAPRQGVNLVKDFQNGVDKIKLNGVSNFGQLAIGEAQGDAVIRFNKTVIRLDGVDSDLIDRSDFIFGRSGAEKPTTETSPPDTARDDDPLAAFLNLGADDLL